jgi:Fic family protein
VVFTRGTAGWIGRVIQKHKQLTAVDLSAEQKERLDRWAEIEFVYSILTLEGANPTREQVEEIVSHGAERVPVGENERTAIASLVSLRTVTSVARANGKAAELTGELLLKLNGPTGAGFRKSTGDTARAPKPVAPEHLRALLEGALRWYTADSFAELNPVEQASIVLLRLIDMQPFEHANERTAMAAASLFTLRSDLPPIIIKPEICAAYRNALDEGMLMNTAPMVETLAEAVERSIGEMIEEAGR